MELTVFGILEAGIMIPRLCIHIASREERRDKALWSETLMNSVVPYPKYTTTSHNIRAYDIYAIYQQCGATLSSIGMIVRYRPCKAVPQVTSHALEP